MSEQNGTLEQALGQVEEVIRKMEGTEVSLEESFALYQQGVEQLKNCNLMLDEIEKKMLVLNQNGQLSEF